MLWTGSNDKSIKVWNLEMVSQTQVAHTQNACCEQEVIERFTPFQSLESHTSWIRALASEKDVLTSASKDNTVKVWNIITATLRFALMASTGIAGLGSQDHEVHLYFLHRL